MKVRSLVFLALLLVTTVIPLSLTLVNAQSKFLGNIFGSASEPTNFSKYWNQVTPENAGKWGSVETSRDSYSWSTLDSIYNYAKNKGFPFKMHTLVWGNQQPSWISSLSQQEQKEEVEEWIREVGNRYPNIDLVDVVNEPLHSTPPYKDAIGGNNNLYGTGWDWVVWSFEKARQYLPNAKLLINEYGIEWGGDDLNKYVNIINILKNRGLIDGIGVQAHGLESISTSTLKSSLDTLAQTGLPIYISELDVDEADDNKQLQIYQTIFPVMWEHSSVKGVTLWGYIQGQIWKTNAYLLRSDGTERPALTWLMQYVKGVTTTTTTTTPTTTVTTTTTTPTTTATATRVTSTITSTRTTTITTTKRITTTSGTKRITTSVRTTITSTIKTTITTTITGTATTTTTPTTTTTTATTTTTTATPTTTTTTATTATGTVCSPATDISIPFTKDGAGTFCWRLQATSTLTDPNNYSNYINSWNLQTLTVNGKDYTNKYAFTHDLPSPINGYWYIYYVGNYAWSHFEAK